MCKKVIAIANQKGGVGKTTTAMNLGAGLTRKGQRVLMIDGDPQGSLTEASGFSPDELEFTIADIVNKIIEDQPISSQDGILHHREGFDLLPANIELSGMEMMLFTAMNRELILKEYIEMMKNNYDYIIIDTNPSLGILTLNALAAADEVIIPVQTHYLAAKGLQLLLNTIARVKKKINPSLQIAGVLLTLVDGRTNDAKEISDIIIQTYGKNIKIYEKKIPISVRATESPREGISLYQYDGKGAAAEAYQAFVEEYTGRK